MYSKVVDEPSYRFRIHVFKDRFHAGELLAQKLKEYGEDGAIALAIPSGGVPVGYMVAERLHIPLDLIIARKIPIPWEPEAGFGALTWDGVMVINKPLVKQLGLAKEDVDRCVLKVRRMLKERYWKFRGGRPFPSLKDRDVILVDDGLASGYTMLASIKSVRRREPRRIVVAVPTASISATQLLHPYAYKVVCLNIREDFLFAVADAYKAWHDLSDDEVLKLLNKATF